MDGTGRNIDEGVAAGGGGGDNHGAKNPSTISIQDTRVCVGRVRGILDNVREDLDAEMFHADDEGRSTNTYDTTVIPSVQPFSGLIAGVIRRTSPGGDSVDQILIIRGDENTYTEDAEDVER